ncbi:kynureninase [Candidatus Berkiella cookevillensis]|uniref:Kynureninase n=1 Tax=Candidatus Berkiella cookevillensis TaxID=437022 RepID=A0A0Q9YT71_9GAMM|nr:kynureninase [Candidatus Berkiella cookevillensis]MCS5708290.1 kynureninase [Candidatus Berkiella cookevillensis]
MSSRPTLVFKTPKEAFHIPQINGKNATYFCGHSLGLQPKRTFDVIQKELTKWKEGAALSYFQGEEPWVGLTEQLCAPLAALVGAKASEVVAMNSLTINLHLMLASFYKPSPHKYKIIIEEGAFPSDRYAVQSHIQWHGFDPKQSLIKVKAKNGIFKTEDLLRVLEEHGDSIMLSLLPGVQYYTGQVLPIAEMTKILKEKEIIAGWDFAHGVGNIPMSLHDWNIDFAVWCHYKYMNSGPGAVAGCFVHEQYATNKKNFRLQGWWGNDLSSRFLMQEAFDPYANAMGWQVSNAAVFSLVPLKATFELINQVGGLQVLRAQSIDLTTYLIQAVKENFENDIELVTPEDITQRGCQLSIAFKNKNAKDICAFLIQQGVVVDFRNPNVIRIAPVPLYNDYDDIDHLIKILQQACQRF